MMKERNNHAEPKRDIARYFLVIPLVILAGWLLQRSPLFGSHNDNESAIAQVSQQERLEALQQQQEEEVERQREQNFRLDVDLNGEKITIENTADLERLGKEFEQMGKEFEKMGEHFEKDFKETLVKELNKGIQEWKKEDLPALKRKLKKLKKELGKELRKNLNHELKNIDTRDLDKHEKELLKNISELVKSLNDD